MARVTRKDVEHVAALARLSLSDEEARRAVSDLDRILEYAQLLQELDTRDVPPTYHVIPLPTPMREDRPEPPIDPELALANAPAKRDAAFVVPRVIGDEDAG